MPGECIYFIKHWLITLAEEEINYAPAEEVKTEPAQPVQPVQEVQPKISEPADDTKVAVKRQSKFNHLKFGDNYDVSAE